MSTQSRVPRTLRKDWEAEARGLRALLDVANAELVALRVERAAAQEARERADEDRARCTGSRAFGVHEEYDPYCPVHDGK